MPRPFYGYIAGAAEDNVSRTANREALLRYALQTSVLVDVSRRAQRTRIFDVDYAAPFGNAPVGISAVSAYRGDLVLPQAAHDEGTPPS